MNSCTSQHRNIQAKRNIDVIPYFLASPALTALMKKTTEETPMMSMASVKAPTPVDPTSSIRVQACTVSKDVSGILPGIASSDFFHCMVIDLIIMSKT